MLTGMVLLHWQPTVAQEETEGIRGDSLAIAEAEAMVETMGEMEIWEWYPWYRIDSYVEMGSYTAGSY
jgi:hypothetical protein